MTFKKLALASAIAALPMTAMAVDVLDDNAMSGVTGQDGIRVTMDLNLSTNVLVHDVDGIANYDGVVNAVETHTFPADATPGPTGVVVNGVLSNTRTVSAAGISYMSQHTTSALAGNSGDAPVVTPLAAEPFDYNNAGAIVITGMGFVSGAGGIQLDIDAGDAQQNGGNATTPTLNILVNIPDGTTLTTGSISVANSNRDDVAWGFEATTDTASIIDSATITLNNTDLNIQLGNEPQGYMILLDTIMTGGLTVTGFALNDVNSGGAIGAGAITVKNNGDANLDITAGIDVTATGLVVDVAAFGDAGGADLRVERMYLGSPDIFGAGTSYVGDLEVQGLNLTGQITISGH